MSDTTNTPPKTRPIMIVSMEGSNSAEVSSIEGLSDKNILGQLRGDCTRVLTSHLRELHPPNPATIKDDFDRLGVLHHDDVMAFHDSLEYDIKQFIASPNEQVLKRHRVTKDCNGDEREVDVIIERGHELIVDKKKKGNRAAAPMPHKRQAKPVAMKPASAPMPTPIATAGKTLTVSLVDTHLSTDINHEDIQSAVHLNTTIGMSGLFLIRQHLAAMGVRFSDDNNSATNQQACLNQITNKVQGLNVSDSATNKDICTMIVDDKNTEHYFTLRLYASAA